MSERIGRIEEVDKLLTEEISETFCLAKWHHTTIYLHRGQTHSCYHPKPHDIPLQELKYDPSVLIIHRRKLMSVFKCSTVISQVGVSTAGT